MGPFPCTIDSLIRGWPPIKLSPWNDWFNNRFIHAFCCEIWKERNARTFKDEAMTWRAVVRKIGNNLLKWSSAHGAVSSHDGLIWLHSIYHACHLIQPLEES
ncbi:unnamed protein product [Linum trigynum]|uniref:Uncharacterized protein n=1 Tax=Linum trigynum TaxID=586398 RepID=A0AAV2EEZ5_9ROSI